MANQKIPAQAPTPAPAPAKVQTHRIACEFLNGPPTEAGNYVVFDAMTTEEYVATVHEGNNGQLHCWSGKTRQETPLAEALTPSQRWFALGELTPSSVRELTMTPVNMTARRQPVTA